MSETIFSRTRIAAAVLAAFGAWAIAACGGDDTSGTISGSSTSLSGTAATGRAIVEARVDAKCVGGEGAAMTGADGRYQMTANGSLPCLLRVTTENGQTLHSIAVSGAVANITPVSELILARLAGAAPASFYDAFDGTTQSLSADQVSAAVREVVQRLEAGLEGTGGDLVSLDDPIGGDLVAATDNNPQGNALDQALDALGAALIAGGTDLAALAEAFAQEGIQAGGTGAGASLPPELLLRKSAATCPSLRSGAYRVVVPMDDAADGRVDLLTLDASTLRASVLSSGRDYQWFDEGQCRFRFDVDDNPSTANDVRVAISSAGVGVLLLQVGDTSNYGVALMFPEQKLEVADLAGSWNSLEWVRDDADSLGRFTAWQGVGQITAAGEVSDEGQTLGSVGPNADGGFDAVGPEFDGINTRVFAYRAGGGETMLVWTSNLNDLMLMTKKRAVSMPAVGDTSATVYAMANSSGLAQSVDFSESNWTVSGVDSPSAGSYVRSSGSSEQIMTINEPAEGYVARTGTATASPMHMLRLSGMGVTAGAIRPGDLAGGLFMLAVDK